MAPGAWQQHAVDIIYYLHNNIYTVISTHETRGVDVPRAEAVEVGLAGVLVLGVHALVAAEGGEGRTNEL